MRTMFQVGIGSKSQLVSGDLRQKLRNLVNGNTSDGWRRKVRKGRGTIDK